MSEPAKRFREYRGKRIAVYGLGAEAVKVLRELKDTVSVVGLLDSCREEGELYGFPVLSLEQAFAASISLILVAARPGSCKAIARRIGRKCRKQGVALYDVRGNDLCAEREPAYDFTGLDGPMRGEILKRIEGKEAVSFDLFDTLIMRQVLFPDDVFELVGAKLAKRGIYMEGFSQKRLAAEKELSGRYAPSLEEIYSYMKESFALSELVPKEAARLEWQTDCSLLIPRKEVCELLETVKKQGKPVYIVTDSYYTKRQIEELLKRFGIEGYAGLLVSCEYGKGKAQGLFRVLKELTGKSCLHIGDDRYTDIEMAEGESVEAVRLYSGADLLELCGYMGMQDLMDSLSDRIRIGMAVSRLFNNPFVTESGERLGVEKARDIGYVFFAPLITDFVFWLRERIEREKISNVLFCARDGYLIRMLYEQLLEEHTSIYFLTSRTAAVCAGAESEEDIRYVEGMRFGGTLQEELAERFGIQINGESISKDKGGLTGYKKEILGRASLARKAYQAYIDRLFLREGDIALFDFVAKGTCQMYLERLMKNHLKGFYFLWLEEEEMRGHGLDIEPFYREAEKEGSTVFENYYILEAVLTAPSPSVRGFTSGGMPIYARETRPAESIACVQEIQEGIRAYFETYRRICPEGEMRINKELDERFLSLIHQAEIREERFLRMQVEDPFFNRTTSLTDLL
ncbi:MAG: HAD hydrolase-like protein [Lachnospiraceae bacterium]|nr:HAD hydrolase-like protein [Lachnospiraceae bacterium]